MTTRSRVAASSSCLRRRWRKLSLRQVSTEDGVIGWTNMTKGLVPGQRGDLRFPARTSDKNAFSTSASTRSCSRQPRPPPGVVGRRSARSRTRCSTPSELLGVPATSCRCKFADRVASTGRIARRGAYHQLVSRQSKIWTGQAIGRECARKIHRAEDQIFTYDGGKPTVAPGSGSPFLPRSCRCKVLRDLALASPKPFAMAQARRRHPARSEFHAQTEGYLKILPDRRLDMFWIEIRQFHPEASG